MRLRLVRQNMARVWIMPIQGTVVEEIAYLLRAMLDSRVTLQLTGYDSGTVASLWVCSTAEGGPCNSYGILFADRADPYLLR